MTEPERIADQLGRAFNGNAWHGPALWEILSDVSAREAAFRPAATVHSIWELVLHVVVWNGVVETALRGGAYAGATGEQDWPPVASASEASWQRALTNLKESYRTVKEAILAFPEDRLSEAVPDRAFSFYEVVHGLIQHAAYHGGQIMLLKKQVRAA